eukprot:4600849-Amphidinium_carterae.2
MIPALTFHLHEASYLGHVAWCQARQQPPHQEEHANAHEHETSSMPGPPWNGPGSTKDQEDDLSKGRHIASHEPVHAVDGDPSKCW